MFDFCLLCGSDFLSSLHAGLFYYKSDNVIFWVLDMFCIPINIPELFWGTQLNFLETRCFFQVSLLNFAKQEHMFSPIL
jgi:hypothetical protein